MVVEIYSIYDRKSRHYSPPRISFNWEVMKRTMTTEMGKPENAQISKHAADYDIVFIGTWDDGTGHIETFGKPEVKGCIEDLIKE